jgi:hypothetical protein
MAKKKLTTEQRKLLGDLKASRDRKAGSMSCDQRKAIALELKALGLIDFKGEIAGSYFYRINEKGLALL